jgi:hypothetical protein
MIIKHFNNNHFPLQSILLQRKLIEPVSFMHAIRTYAKPFIIENEIDLSLIQQCLVVVTKKK